MKKILFLALLAIATIANAQDIIVTNDAKKIEAKILEVTKNEIKYKDFDNQDGPIFVLETTDISSVIYSNGKVVLYGNQNAQESTPKTTTKAEEDDPELKAWDEEYEREKKQKEEQRQRQAEQERLAREESQRQQEQIDAQQQKLQESLDDLGATIQDLVRAKNSYALDIYNTTRDPYKIILDGKVLGVVNPYKAHRFIIPIQQYGRMQAVQVSGYLLYPTVKEYRVPPQKKQTAYTVKIQ